MVKKVLLALGLLFVLFLFWYRATYSMSSVEPSELNQEGRAGRVLIAGQGSPYKDAVLKDLSSQLVAGDFRVRTIDVSGLGSIDPADWTAVVIMHTWEMWKPQADAATFVLAHPDAGNVIVLSTSGGGDERLDPVDGISSASVVEDAAKDASALMQRVMDVGGH